jgi:hypothetical protein
VRAYTGAAADQSHLVALTGQILPVKEVSFGWN